MKMLTVKQSGKEDIVYEIDDSFLNNFVVAFLAGNMLSGKSSGCSWTIDESVSRAEEAAEKVIIKPE